CILFVALTLRHGQGEPEDGTVAGIALDADLAAVALDDLLADVEAQTGATRWRIGKPEEALEQQRLELSRNAAAGVAHLEAEAAVLRRSPKRDATVGRGMAERVLDEIREHELHAIGIGLDRPIDGERVDFQRDPLFLRLLAMLVDGSRQERARGHRST